MDRDLLGYLDLSEPIYFLNKSTSQLQEYQACTQKSKHPKEYHHAINSLLRILYHNLNSSRLESWCLWFKSIITGSYWKKRCLVHRTQNLSEDWNPNLNFIWVPWQIWEHPWTCFLIQARFISRLNLCESQTYYRYWAHWFFSPFSLSLWQKKS